MSLKISGSGGAFAGKMGKIGGKMGMGGGGGGSAQDYSALATQMIGAVGQAFGSFYSARSQKRQLELQAFMQEMNARRFERGAQQALRAGEKQAAALSLQSGQLKSAQRAALGAAGVDLGVGSAAELQAGTDYFKEADMNQIAANALADAWGLRAQGLNESNSALMARANARSINPMASGMMTLLTGAGKVADSWAALQKVGAIGGGSAPASAPVNTSNSYTKGMWR